MANSTIQDLTEATNVDRTTTAIEVETSAPASRKMSIRNAVGGGFGFYADATYTSGSPLAVNNALTQLTNDGAKANSELSQLPVDAAGSAIQLWDTANDYITPVNVLDAYDLRLQFKATTSTPSAYLRVRLNIGTIGTPIWAVERFFSFVKGTGIEHPVSIGLPFFVSSDFFTNKGRLYIDTTGASASVNVYDIDLLVKRDYAAK